MLLHPVQRADADAALLVYPLELGMQRVVNAFVVDFHWLPLGLAGVDVWHGVDVLCGVVM